MDDITALLQGKNEELAELEGFEAIEHSKEAKKVRVR